jgi:hypothetical protein
MPSTSKSQARLMAAAAHTKGGFGGVPQSVGKEFNMADSQKRESKKFNKGGAVESSAHQAFENNKAEALVYPGPSPKLAKGGSVGGVKPATGGWKRWGKK